MLIKDSINRGRVRGYSQKVKLLNHQHKLAMKALKAPGMSLREFNRKLRSGWFGNSSDNRQKEVAT